MWRTSMLIAGTVLLIACTSGDVMQPTLQPQNEFFAYTCPGGFEAGVYATPPADKDGTIPVSVDTNGDHVICAMSFEDEAGAIHSVEMDNNVPVSQTGTCPPPFVGMGAFAGDPADNNHNGVVCVLNHKNGQSVIDDNYQVGQQGQK